AAFAFERAGRLYERALTHAALSDDEKQQLRIALGETLTNAGHGAEAARAFEDAAAHATSADATLELRRRVAEELLTAGRFDEGEAALREVLRAVGLSLPRTPIGTLVGLLLLRLVVVLRGVAFRERAATDVPPQAITRVDSCASVGTIFATVDTIRGAYFQTRTLLYALGVGEPNRVAHALAIEAVYSATAGDSSRSTALLDRAAS